MKKKWILVLCVLFSGCMCILAPQPNDFFGIQMNSISEIGSLKINSYDQNGIKYTHSGAMNSDIYAYGTLVSSSELHIEITNGTSNPISTNYFTDSFELIRSNGKRYILEKPDILRYPEGSSINPDESAYFYLILPYSLRGITKDQISSITCSIGKFGRLKVILVELPDKEEGDL